MGRSGLAMPHVKSDAAQAATYSKRKNGLLKKGKELSILCGVEVAVICHNSRLGGPLTWSQPSRLDSVVARYMSVPVEERAKRKLDNTSLLHGQVGKMSSDLQQLAAQNGKLAHHLEHAVWDERLNALAPAELEQIAVQVLAKKKELMECLAQIGPLPWPLTPHDHLHNLQNLQVPISPTKDLTKNAALLNQFNMMPVPLLQCMPKAAVAFDNTHNHHHHHHNHTSPNNFIQGGVKRLRSSLTRSPHGDHHHPPGPITVNPIEPAESASSMVSGAEELDAETPTSSNIMPSDHLFGCRSMMTSNPMTDSVLGFEQLLGLPTDFNPAGSSWYTVTPSPVTGGGSEASDLVDVATTTKVRTSDVVSGKMENFCSDLLENWVDGIGCGSVNPLLQLSGACQPTQNLQVDPGFWMQHVV